MKKVLIRYNPVWQCEADYRQRLIDLSGFYQKLPYDHNYTIIDTDDLDQAFAKVPADTEWLVITSLGHCSQDRNLFDECIQLCKQSGNPMMCHIMDYPDQYPHLHPQLVVVNYQLYNAVGKPSWNYQAEPAEFTSVGIQSSLEKFHDNYTPHWIKTNGREQLYQVSELQTGAKVIRKFVEQGFTISNFSDTIRDKKFYLYPETNINEFNSFLHGEPYTGTNSAQKWYTGLIEHLAGQVRRQYYVLNTEPLVRLPAERTITHYAGVSSGLKLVATMIKNGYNSDTCVTHFDFSSAAIEFQQYILLNWSGDLDEYQKVCQQFKQRDVELYPCEPLGDWQSNIKHLLDYLGITKEEFKHHWANYRDLSINFMPCDLYNPVDQAALAEVCAGHSSNYVWVSNAFYMEYSLIKQGKTKLQSIRQSFIDHLTNSGKPITLDLEDTWVQGLIPINY